MGLDVWFRDDITRILAATYTTMHTSTAATGAGDPERLDAYRQGFEDALKAVAVACGVELGQTRTPLPPGGIVDGAG